MNSPLALMQAGVSREEAAWWGGLGVQGENWHSVKTDPAGGAATEKNKVQ